MREREVGLCSQLLAARPRVKERKPTGRVAPWDAEADLEAVLGGLPRVAHAGRQAEYTLAQYVRKARELGASWAAIGQALGTARQSAWERFSGEA